MKTSLVWFNWQEVRYQAPAYECSWCGFAWTDSAKENAEIAAMRAAGYRVDDQGTVFAPEDTPLANELAP